MIRKSGHRFSEKIMLEQKLERDDDSKKSHHVKRFQAKGLPVREKKTRQKEKELGSD
jgi:hypothetical protein